MDIERHNHEIQANRERWQRKPVLQRIYRGFYELIAAELAPDLPGATVEIGSGIGNLKMVLPQAICTDLFPNPWLDQVEDIYRLSFPADSIANFVLFDVFHHLQYPGDALESLRRALRPGGRVVIFEPDVSLTGLLVYGAFHPEPLGLFRTISWQRSGTDNWQQGYYAAQGNAARIFRGKSYRGNLQAWRVLKQRRLSSFAYLGSGGYAGRQLYPAGLLPLLQRFDRILNCCPTLFSSRLLVVLEKL